MTLDKDGKPIPTDPNPTPPVQRRSGPATTAAQRTAIDRLDHDLDVPDEDGKPTRPAFGTDAERLAFEREHGLTPTGDAVRSAAHGRLTWKPGDKARWTGRSSQPAMGVSVSPTGARFSEFDRDHSPEKPIVGEPRSRFIDPRLFADLDVTVRAVKDDGSASLVETAEGLTFDPGIDLDLLQPATTEPPISQTVGVVMVTLLKDGFVQINAIDKDKGGTLVFTLPESPGALLPSLVLRRQDAYDLSKALTVMFDPPVDRTSPNAIEYARALERTADRPARR